MVARKLKLGRAVRYKYHALLESLISGGTAWFSCRLYLSCPCHSDDAEPEWFTEDVCMTDTIELKGFDGHKEKIERREKKEREKKERKAGEKKGGTTSAADQKVRVISPLCCSTR